MQRGNLDDLLAFLAVGRERSFTKAAAKLGISQSSLSHTIRELEARLGVRLLTRTTRSVSPTAAGERLLQNLGPRFEEIDAELAALGELREKPAGTIRITTMEYAAETILLPKLAKLIREYPEIKVEIIIDYGLTDIVAERYDAGVRSGEQVAKDMIAVRVGPDMRMAVVGAPSYFRKRSEPKKPQELIAHNCINLRLPSHGGLYAWEFEKGDRELKVRVEGQMTFNSATQMLNAALAGYGSRTCRKASCSRTSPRGASSGCSRIGASRIRDITFSTRAAASLPRPSIWLSRRCASGAKSFHLVCVPSMIGDVRMSLSDRTIFSVDALYFLK
jgi:DNA-binding transcriptional LysR family regulator